VLQFILDADKSRGAGSRFRIEQTDTTFHVIPTETRDVDGQWVRQDSILDTALNITTAELSGAELLNEICGQISEKIRTPVVVGVIPATSFLDYRGRLEVRNERARDVLLKLAESAAVLIESFRPGTIERMGLGPELLHSRNPKLVVARITGWGQTGPYSRRPGFGTLVEGMSGFASMNGFADREPVLPPFYLADTIAGLYGASAVLIALREVETNGGKGQVIDLPLLDSLFSVLGAQAANYKLTGKVKPRTGSRSTNSAPRNASRSGADSTPM